MKIIVSQKLINEKIHRTYIVATLIVNPWKIKLTELWRLKFSHRYEK